MEQHIRLLFCAATLGFAACATTPQPAPEPAAQPPAAEEAPPPAPAAPPEPESLTVDLASASGSSVTGTVTFTEADDGVRVSGEVRGLEPGAHGFHVHEFGDCSAPDASSAGGHYNPTDDPHGRDSSGPHHVGDMDNIEAGEDGVATVDMTVEGMDLGGGGPTDITGKAVVVHGGTDDYTSQPSGDAGTRVACGVIPSEAD